MDWMELFEIKKEQALALKAEIDKTDREIDQMVYELYDLTAEEIAIVEESTGGTKAGETSTATSADQKIMDELAEKSKKKTTAKL